MNISNCQCNEALESQIGSHSHTRMGYLWNAIESTVACSWNGILGTGAGAAAVITLGKSESINSSCYDRLQKATPLLHDLYSNLIKFLNPNAKFDRTDFYANLSERLQKIHLKPRSNSSLNDDVMTRTNHGVDSLVLTIDLLARTLLGCLAAVASFATLGTRSKVNGFAESGLEFFPDGMGDLARKLIKTVNPNAKFTPLYLPNKNLLDDVD